MAGEVDADGRHILRTFEVDPKRIKPTSSCMLFQEGRERPCLLVGLPNHHRVSGIILPDGRDRFSIDLNVGRRNKDTIRQIIESYTDSRGVHPRCRNTNFRRLRNNGLTIIVHRDSKSTAPRDRDHTQYNYQQTKIGLHKPIFIWEALKSKNHANREKKARTGSKSERIRALLDIFAYTGPNNGPIQAPLCAKGN